ncbi:YhaN family protein [Geoalkalibacter sp.]|uniref:YhaN family protein n=1 Tax=Geoalkalibacter sp. TaxID=3041440 RepID=UPI00272E6854|nr:YhaN family protein [Geoalkalibacter sp.]
MKLELLDLKAFGPFTDKVLDFSGPLPGLHVVFGRNEAGKSSSLRGLKALLYGFPERTTDNFVHPNEQLLVGGRLRGADGRALVFQRRKKRKADLLDVHGNPLDPGELAAFLHGIEPAVFDALFGIDHETLVSGGQDILEQKGDLGRSLFAAGTGIACLRRILDDLREESDALFKARGSKPEINQALAEYRELQKTLRETSLAAGDWKKLQQTLQDAQAALETLREEQRRCERQKRHLERLRQALPQLAQRRALLAELADLGPVVPLPDDFNLARRGVQEQKRAAEQRLRDAEQRLSDLEQRAAGLSPPRALLDQAESVEELARRLGEYRKGLQDRPSLDGRRRQLKSEAGDLLRQIRPDLPLEGIEALRPMLARRKAIHQLGARREALEQSLRGAERQVRQYADELDKLRRDLAEEVAPPDAEPLQHALARTQKAGEIDEDVRERGQVQVREEQRLAVELKRLGLWSGSWQALLELCLPAAETLSREDERLRRLSDDQERARRLRQDLQDEKRRLVQAKAEMEAAGELPTEGDLREIRRSRDQGWQLLRRQWLGGEDVAVEARAYHAKLPLPEAFEQALGTADETADRLRREAARVHQYAALVAQLDIVAERLAEAQRAEAEYAEALARFQQDWQALWAPCGICPQPPREMALWRAEMEKLRLRVEAWQRAAVELDERRDLRARLRQALVDELAHLGETPAVAGEDLAEVFSAAQQVMRRLEQSARRRAEMAARREDLERSLLRAQVESEEARGSLHAWRDHWQAVLADLGLSADALPGEVDDFLETLQKCFDYLRQADDFQKRIDGIDRDAQGYAAAVRALQSGCAPDLVDLAPDQVVVQMQARLNRGREEQSRLHQLIEDRCQVEDDIRRAAGDLRDAQIELARMCNLARCADEMALDEAERTWARHQRLRERLGDVEARLLQIGEGLSFSDLDEQAGRIDGDELPTLLAEVTLEMEERLDPEISRLNQRIGETRKELERMDGGPRAALTAEQAERTLARLRRLAERYAQLRVAAHVLDNEIERYRAENQDPLLTIASRIFARLTLDAFRGLRADIGDQGQPVLVGVRADGRHLEVAGMSSGTRDQLYLALRLASLEWRLERHDAMPFIVDDILINFDDERSRATLQSLADLGRRNQVILFTHHRQVAETAQRFADEGLAVVHEL